MQGKARQQAEPRPAPLLGLHDDAGRRLALLGEQRKDGDVAEATFEQRQQLAKTIGAVDQGQQRLRRGHGGKEADPCGKAPPVHDMRRCPPAIGCRSDVTLRVEGRVGNHLIVAFAQQPRGAERFPRRGDVGIDDTDLVAEAVPLRVLGGQRAEPGVDLDRGQLDAGHASQDAKSRDAHAGTDIEHAHPGARRHGGGEKYRVAPGAVAAFRLQHADAPAEKIVGGGGARSARRRLGFLLVGEGMAEIGLGE